MEINYNIPDYASAVRHLGNLTGVYCQIHFDPEMRSRGLFSLPTASEDLVRIASKYGIQESVTGDSLPSVFQLVRIVDKLSEMGVINRAEFDRYIFKM